MAINLLYIIFAIIGLGFLVFIHEFGHYIVALRQGMKVEAFAIGFGKPLFTWMHKGVQWRICMLPFGGYVKIAGMQKEGNREPSEIPDGFFGKTPWQRIKVAIAGPLVNIAFAFVVFVVLWASGGRTKPFTETTRYIGWVDPKSALYEKGVRPGDFITTYSGHSYSGFKDLLMVGLTKASDVQISGFKIDPTNGNETNYDYTLKTYQNNDRFRTIGVLAPANYLIFSGNAQAESMKASGIQPGDRIIWADGEFIASNYQLSNLINESTALLTVKRGAKEIQVKVPRMPIDEFKLASFERGEMDDWQYEAGLKGRLQDHYFIPYLISPDLSIESPLQLFGEKKISYSLKEGDRILAVDGIAVQSPKDLFERLQTRRVRMIVQRDPALVEKTLWTNADSQFETFSFSDLSKLTSFNQSTIGNLHLLEPVTPVPLSQLFPEQKLQKDLYVLGVTLKDREVRYNPAPGQQFSEVLQQTWTTLYSLFTGQGSPKNLAGPIGIISIVQQSWSYGYKEALFWLALISLNLGIMNLLPLPVLDGGHILFSAFEIITRRRLKSKTMERLIIPFVGLMIFFFIFVTYQDITRLFSKFF